MWKPRVELDHNQINLSSKLLHLILLALTPPTQYHKPMRNPLLTKAERKKTLSTLSWKILEFHAILLIFLQLSKFIHPFLPTEAQVSCLRRPSSLPSLLSIFPSHFPDIIHFKLLLTTFNGSLCLQNKVQLLWQVFLRRINSKFLNPANLDFISS